MSTAGRDVLIVREAQVRELIGPADALAAARRGFVKLARGEVEQPDVLGLDLHEHRGDAHAKGAYIHGEPYYSIKVASGFYDNPKVGLPVLSGAVWVFDARTGVLVAMLFDNGYLTDLRTGAAGALATDLLAVDAPATATIVGSGGQARYQLEALLEVRTPKEVLVWGRRREAAQQLVDEVAAGSSVNIDVADSLQAAVARADIVVTTTPSRAPLIDAAWVGPGTHITAVGSDLPGKVELDPKLLARATVVADRLSQCRTQGEISAALAAGTLELDDVHAELGEIAAGDKPGRSSLDEVTVADLTGVGVLDAAVAVLVTQRALERGVGERLRI
jgi:ornithine cyclodeaminase/alanine dehydrogenase-like protein (mu-crystallin family)